MKYLIFIITTLQMLSNISNASGLDVGEETLKRFLTERLSSQQKYEIIRNDLNQMALKDRIKYYSKVLDIVSSRNFDQSIIDTIYLKILSDLKQVPQDLFKRNEGQQLPICNFSEDGALNCVAEKTIDLAMSNLIMSPNVAWQYVSSFFEMNWLSSGETQSAAISLGRNKKLNYPYMRFMAKKLLETDFPTPRNYKEVIAFDLLGMVRYEQFKTGRAVDFSGYDFGYEDSLWILDLVVSSGYATSEKQDTLASLRRIFELGVEFERRSVGLDENQKSELLKSMIKVSGDAPGMSEVAYNWLLKNRQSIDIQNDVIATLVKELDKEPKERLIISFNNSSRGALNVLTDLPIVFSLPKELEEEIYQLVIDRFSGDGKIASGAQNLIVFKAFDSESKIEFPGFQMALELLAEKANKADFISDRIGDEKELKYSNMGELIDTVHSCQINKPIYGSNMKACSGIVNANAILKKVISNKYVKPVIKNRAQSYLKKT